MNGLVDTVLSPLQDCADDSNHDLYSKDGSHKRWRMVWLV
jgi:hypothetical protein